jgi:hypothetical protein
MQCMCVSALHPVNTRNEDKDRHAVDNCRVDALLEKQEERRIVVLSDILNIP